MSLCGHGGLADVGMEAPPFLASNGRTRRLTGRPLSTGQFSDLFQAAAHVGVVVTLSEASGNSYCTWAGAGSGNGVSRIPGVPAGRKTLIARRVTETRIGLSGRPSSRRQEGLGKRPIPSRGSILGEVRSEAQIVCHWVRNTHFLRFPTLANPISVSCRVRFPRNLRGL